MSTMIEAPGLIQPEVLYTRRELCRRLRLGDWGWRKLRHSGLPVYYFGKLAVCRGSDVIQTLTDSKTDTNGDANKS